MHGKKERERKKRVELSGVEEAAGRAGLLIRWANGWARREPRAGEMEGGAKTMTTKSG